MKSKLLLLLVIFLMGIVLSADFFKLQDYCSFSCSRNFDGVFLNWFVFLSVNLVLLCFLYFFPNMYKKWWSFARFAIPTFLVLSTAISAGVLHTSPGTWQNILDLPALTLLYVLFILGSLILIIRGYYQK